MVALFYCAFSRELQCWDSIWVLLKQVLLGRVVLGFPKPLECTNSSSPYQLYDLRVYNGQSQMWYSVRTDSPRGWLESSSFGARCCHQLAQPSVSFCSSLASLCFLCIPSSSQDSGPLSLVSQNSSDLTVYSISIHGFLSFEPMPTRFLFYIVDSPSAAVLLLLLISSTDHLALWLSLHYKCIIVYKMPACSVVQWSGAVRKESGPSLRKNPKMEQNSNTQSFTSNTLSGAKSGLQILWNRPYRPIESAILSQIAIAWCGA